MSGKVLDRREDFLRGADPVDLGVAQFLDLARAANVTFVLVDGRLVMLAARMDWKLWRTLRRCLDELGVVAIMDYFRRTTPEDREVLSAAA